MKRSSVWMVSICVSLVLLSGFCQFVICSEEKETYDENKNNNFVRMKLGGISDSTSDSNGGGEEIDDIAFFAVQEHNKREVWFPSSNLISFLFFGN